MRLERPISEPRSAKCGSAPLRLPYTLRETPRFCQKNSNARRHTPPDLLTHSLTPPCPIFCILSLRTQGCPLVVYGCMSGKSPQFSWNSWVFRDLQVRGFNLRRWMTVNKKKARAGGGDRRMQHRSVLRICHGQHFPRKMLQRCLFSPCARLRAGAGDARHARYAGERRQAPHQLHGAPAPAPGRSYRTWRRRTRVGKIVPCGATASGSVFLPDSFLRALRGRAADRE